MCSTYFHTFTLVKYLQTSALVKKSPLLVISLLTGQLDCKITKLGKEYVGLKNVTISGLTCQAWSSQYPHKHTLSDNEVLRRSRNYCRNPDGEPEGPWCYTTNNRTRWQYCGIPSCRKL